ncbi:MAG: hypothetical protein C5B55_08300 [Blastocatellia bacterium]|nr:MAG: hypothetical protein C5B55_08300 [Blastocatellia bacterium]
MHKFSTVARIALPRLLLTAFIGFLLIFNSACSLFGTHKKVQVPQLLPLSNANRSRLIEEVNRLTAVHSMHGKIDIEFEDTSFASVGIAEKYRQVDGTVTLQRPGKIYLIIQFTFVDIAQMASDGEHFAVAVLKGDDKYKRFVKGTNSAVYPKLATDGIGATSKDDKQKEKQTVSALSNLRPQHLTDALLPKPIDLSDGLIYAQSEFFQEEADTRSTSKKGTRVLRGYYLLEEMTTAKDNESRLLRRFWFDRTSSNGVRLARLQTYDDRGLLVTDVSYFDDKPFGTNTTASLPARIEITRPQDQYKLKITYQDPTSVELNKEYRPEAFVLENKWQLPEVDLDAQNKKTTANR